MLDADDWWLAELGVSGAATSKPASVATRGASTSLARRRRSFHTGSLRARGRVLDRRRADQPRDWPTVGHCRSDGGAARGHDRGLARLSITGTDGCLDRRTAPRALTTQLRSGLSDGELGSIRTALVACTRIWRHWSLGGPRVANVWVPCVGGARLAAHNGVIQEIQRVGADCGPHAPDRAGHVVQSRACGAVSGRTRRDA